MRAAGAMLIVTGGLMIFSGMTGQSLPSVIRDIMAGRKPSGDPDEIKSGMGVVSDAGNEIDDVVRRTAREVTR